MYFFNFITHYLVILQYYLTIKSTMFMSQVGAEALIHFFFYFVTQHPTSF